MAIDIELVREYRCDEQVVSVRGKQVKQFVEIETGACSVLEYTINGVGVRFVQVMIPLNTQKRQFGSTWVKEIKNEIGEWEQSQGSIDMITDDTQYVYAATGESVPVDQAFEMVQTDVEQKDQLGNSYDPKQFVKERKLREGYMRETDFLILANEVFLRMTQEKAKIAISKRYGA